MKMYDYEEEEVTENELKSVAYTTASVMVIFSSTILWILFA